MPEGLLWVQRDGPSILRGAGADAQQALPFWMVPLLVPTVQIGDAHQTAPQPAIPTRFLSATSPAVAASRSVVEVYAGQQECVVWVWIDDSTAGRAWIEEVATSTSRITAGRATVTGGSTMYATPTWVLQTGSNNGAARTDVPDAGMLQGYYGGASGTLRRIPRGHRLVCEGNALATALRFDLVASDIGPTAIVAP